jgi:polygalacturonase/sugar lactone lactonase YvrE
MLLRVRRAFFILTLLVSVSGLSANAQAPAVATGDSRTVTEPSFPAVCATLTANLTSVNDDIPTSVDATTTNPDGARIQAALTGCAGTNQAVRLSTDGASHNAFLTGPLAMVSGVTLLVDPGVVVYFSRNVQDYDVTPGTHTCGTVNSASATSSCLPLINVTGVSNVGIMGFGKLDGRGGDTLLNAFPASYAGQSWWGLSAIANSGGSQQNPRFIQLSNSTNVTLYKITLKNSPLFHVSGSANGLTAWDVKIVTPTTSRNTDGIDPDQAQNVTITKSWISDGDDNVAVGASGSASSASVNISIINNHFFAGHGESIGSYTSAGVNNVLWDSNMSAGNNSVDSNSTGIRIKSANDRGGVVQNIQYSNSCYQNHKAEIQFTPLYNTNTGTLTPNFKNILMQNLTFLTEGTVQFTGASNNGTVNPLTVTLDNVNFNTVSTSDFSVAPTNAQLTFGPGQVSTNFVNAYKTYVGVNGNTLADNRTATSLVPPTCNFTFIAPELTGPTGLPQTIQFGQTATAMVILTPAVGGSAYPTGTVTLTDGAASTSTATLPGTGDTISIPLSNLSVGTHTFTATYSGDANYVPTAPATTYSTTNAYAITVNAATLATSTTGLSGVPSGTTYGTSFTMTANVTGTNPTGSVQFVVNGVVYATAPLASGSAQAMLSLPLGSYTISAVYTGDSVNAGSVSSPSSLTVSAAATTTTLTSNTTTTTGGVPVQFTATVASAAGTPTGTVNFTYTVSPSNTPSSPVATALTNGVAIASLNLPTGTVNVTATYVASGNYAGSASAPPLAITVNPPVSVPLGSSPLALPYTISTVGGSSLASTVNTSCTGSTDSFGDGCAATAITLNVGTQDLRSVAADPFGNVYFTDANASLVRRISASGVVTNYAGRVTGTACVPTATVVCTPTLVSLNKPRGISTDAKGNLYIAGYSDSKAYEVSAATGLLYLVAGTGTKGTAGQTNGNGSTATAANLNQPRGIWADTIGNVYIADTADNQIRVVSSTGSIQAFAGAGAASSTGDGGVATTANVNNPQGVLTDLSDNVYIAETSKIRVVCVTCAAGSGLYQLLKAINSSTTPTNGNIYTLAGGGSTYTGSAPVLATSVSMSPQKIAIDANSNLYISDSTNNVIWFLDSHTGYIRIIAGGATSTTTCNGATASVGDGCHATQANIGSNGGNGIGIGNDVLGNIYISDTTNFRIRKVSTNLQFAATADATTAAQPVYFHFLPNDTPASSNAFAYTSPEWSLGTPSCTVNTATDKTDDCLLTASFTPAVPGARFTPLTVTSSLGNTAALGLLGTGTGAGATLDPASQISFGSNLLVKGIATDNAGNVYVADGTSNSLLRFLAAATRLGAGATSSTLATLTAPSAVAVDSRGYAYVADTSTGLITQVTPGGAASTLPFKFTTPAGLAVDALNNLYVSDSAAKAVYEVSPYASAQRTLVSTGLVTPTGLTIDPSGNLVIADPGAAAIYRLNPTLQKPVLATISTPASAPANVVSDAAGNLLIADTNSLIAVPKSANSAAFTISTITPSSIAVDSAGNLYTGANGGVVEFNRTVGSLVFAYGGAAQSASLLGSGNVAVALPSVSQSDTMDYTLTAAASSDCTVASNLPSTVAAGGGCTLNASYAPTVLSTTTDTVTFTGNVTNASLSSPAAVQLLLTGPSPAPTPTVTISAISPSVPSVGQSVSVTATVAGGAIVPTGSVTFTVDSTTTTIALTNGSATDVITGLGAGGHMVSATYTSTNGYANAASSQSAFTVSQTVMPTVVFAGSGSVGSLYENGTVQTGAVAGGGIGVAVDSNGYVWSINAAGTGVTRFTDAGAVDSTFAGVGGISSATSLAFDGAGTIWITNGSGMVSGFSNAGAAVSSKQTSTTTAPSGVAIDISGNLWVTNSGANTVDEVIGGAAPVVPLATAVQNGAPAAKP